jgi:hypothetical protein
MNRLTYKKAFRKTNIYYIIDYVVTLNVDDKEDWKVVGV